VEHGQEAGRYFEVMELIVGDSLRNLTRYSPLDEITGSHLLTHAVAALESLHQPDGSSSFIIHRDIKPEHLLWCFDRSQWFVCDFGVALLENTHTPRGADCPDGSTPHYAAPETILGAPQIKSDYWSLGMTLFEAMNGAHPLSGLTSQEVRSRIPAGCQFNVASVNNARWEELFAGLLQHKVEMRWGGTEVHGWLDQERSRNTKNDNGSTTEDQSTREGGGFASQPALANHLARHWEQSARMLTDNVLDNSWLRQQLLALGFTGFDNLLLEEAPSQDVLLVRLLYRLDPELAPIWKVWLVDEDGMVRLCNSALMGDVAMQDLTQNLFQHNVLGEIGTNSIHTSLTARATAWNDAYMDYCEAWDLVETRGGLACTHLDDGLALAELYLALVNGSLDSVSVPERLAMTEWCCPWATPLLYGPKRNSAGYRLVAARTIHQCVAEQQPEHLRLSHDIARGTRIFGTITMTRGSNAPVVAFGAVYTPVNFTICKQKTQVGNRVELSWDVSGAFWVYLMGIGRVTLVDSIEITVGESRQFTLVAVGGHGITVCRLPLISMNVPVLRPQVTLRSVAKFARSALTAANLSRNKHMNRQIDFTHHSMTAADLPEQQLIPLEAKFLRPPLGAVDLPRQAQWKELNKTC
jgi:serine/threonine protein kinase